MAESRTWRAYDGPTDADLRFVWRLGLACAAAYAALLAGLALTIGEPYTIGWQLALGQIAGGRGVSVSGGMEHGYSRLLLFFQVTLQDFITLFLLYPIAVASYQHATRVPYIGGFILGIRESAERHRDTVQPWGPLGIAAFVLFPFWSTGAPVGCILGYLIKLPMWRTFIAVLIGDAIGVAGWIVVFGYMQSIAKNLASYVPYAILLCALTAILLGSIHRRRSKQAEQAAEAPAEALAIERLPHPPAHLPAPAEVQPHRLKETG